MAEIYEDWVVRPMTRAEYNQLSDEEKKERKRLQKSINGRKKYQENREERIAKQKKYNEEHKEEKKIYDRQYHKEYYEEHKEEIAEKLKQYQQTAAGKKVYMLAKWKSRNLQETEEELDRIHELYLQQEFCYSCDVKLTRDGVCSTQAVLDHDHTTHRFRHIICRDCNSNDKWMKYFC